VTLSFNTAQGVSLSEATQIVERAKRDLGMPSTIRGNFAGTAQVAQASWVTMPWLFLTALVAVYIILGILYESLIHPITILSTIPSAGLGALLAMLVTGNELDLVSVIGIILLIGIVKKNAIMMVDFALDAERHEGLSPEESIYQACLVRFRPIMMTTMAAMFGALPLAIGMGIGSELRKPLGVCHRWGACRFADAHALHDSRDLFGARPTAAAEKKADFACCRSSDDRLAASLRVFCLMN